MYVKYIAVCEGSNRPLTPHISGNKVKKLLKGGSEFFTRPSFCLKIKCK
jgi:hypothetical protein